MKYVHCVIFIAGMYYSHRKWMDFELDMAINNKIPTICLKPWGAEKLPKRLKEETNLIVAWNTDSIINAIIELSNFKANINQ